MHSVLSLVNDKDQVTELAIEEYPISLPQETLGLHLQYGLGYYLLGLWNVVQSVLTESEQRV